MLATESKNASDIRAMEHFNASNLEVLRPLTGVVGRVGIEPSRLAEPSEPAELTRAEPKISEWRADRARGLARSLAHRANERAEPRASGGVRSLGSLFCNI